MLGMSLVRLPFHEGTIVPSDPSQKFLDVQKFAKEQPFHRILLRSFLTREKRDRKKQLAKI
jgi:hypothetical protein